MQQQRHFTFFFLFRFFSSISSLLSNCGAAMSEFYYILWKKRVIHAIKSEQNEKKEKRNPTNP